MEAPEGPSPPGGNAASVPGGGGPARERPRFRGTQDWREEDDPLKYLKGAAYYKELRAQKAAKEKERRRLVKALASGAPPSGATAAAGRAFQILAGRARCFPPSPPLGAGLHSPQEPMLLVSREATG